TGPGQDEGSGADGHDPGTETVSAAKGVEELRVRLDLGRRPAGNHDRVGAVEGRKTERRLDHEPGLRPHAACPRGYDEELVPRRHDVASVGAEHLAGNCEVERQCALVDDRRDSVHGPKLAKVGSEPPAGVGTLPSWMTS